MCDLEKMYEAIIQRHGKLVVSPEFVGYKSEKISINNPSKKNYSSPYNPYSKKERKNG